MGSCEKTSREIKKEELKMKYFPGLVFFGLLFCLPFINAQYGRACEGLSWGSLIDCMERELNTVVSYYDCGGSDCRICPFCSRSDNKAVGCLGYVTNSGTKVDCCVARDGKPYECVAPAGAEEVDSTSGTAGVGTFKQANTLQKQETEKQETEKQKQRRYGCNRRYGIRRSYVDFLRCRGNRG